MRKLNSSYLFQFFVSNNVTAGRRRTGNFKVRIFSCWCIWAICIDFFSFSLLRQQKSRNKISKDGHHLDFRSISYRLYILLDEVWSSISTSISLIPNSYSSMTIMSVPSSSWNGDFTLKGHHRGNIRGKLGLGLHKNDKTLS